jgi:hypothetical protein
VGAAGRSIDQLARIRRRLGQCGAEPQHLPAVLGALRVELDGKPLAAVLANHLSRRNTTTESEWNRDALTLAKAAMEVLSGRLYRRGRPGLSARNLDEVSGLHVRLVEAKDEVQRGYLRKAARARMRFAPAWGDAAVPKAGVVRRRRGSRAVKPAPQIDWDMTVWRSERTARAWLDKWRAAGARVPWRSFVRSCAESWPHAVVRAGEGGAESRVTTGPAPRFLSATDAAKALGIGRKAMQGHCERGVIRARRLGNPRSRWRLEAKDLDVLVTWLAEHRPATARRVAAHLRGAA